MIDEALGAGTPTGCSEDTYLFYKVLKQGYTIIYEPKSYVWHKHRTDLKSLKKQIYNYSKGHVAYHLQTWLADKDWRGIARILGEMPPYQIKQLLRSLLGRSSYPSSLIWLEIKGYLTGPWAYWRSLRNVKKQGRSAPYKTRIKRLQTLNE
jgi:GT2 family glycosyltransferase